jgi:hypothetical protein
MMTRLLTSPSGIRPHADQLLLVHLHQPLRSLPTQTHQFRCQLPFLLVAMPTFPYQLHLQLASASKRRAYHHHLALNVSASIRCQHHLLDLCNLVLVHQRLPGLTLIHQHLLNLLDPRLRPQCGPPTSTASILSMALLNVSRRVVPDSPLEKSLVRFLVSSSAVPRTTIIENDGKVQVKPPEICTLLLVTRLKAGGPHS